MRDNERFVQNKDECARRPASLCQLCQQTLKSNICSSAAVFIISCRLAYTLLYTCAAHLDVV